MKFLKLYKATSWVDSVQPTANGETGANRERVFIFGVAFVVLGADEGDSDMYKLRAGAVDVIWIGNQEVLEGKARKRTVSRRFSDGGEHVDFLDPPADHAG